MQTEGQTVRLCIDVDPVLRRRIRYAALDQEMTVRELVVALISEGLKNMHSEPFDEQQNA